MRRLIVILFILAASQLAAINLNKIENKVWVGSANFKKNTEVGYSLSNETIFHFNKIVNPGIQIIFQNGRFSDEKTPFGYLSYDATICFSGYSNLLRYKRHSLIASGGIGLSKYAYNDIINSLDDVYENRIIYDVTSVVQFRASLNYQVSYEYSISGSNSIGIKYSTIIGKNDLITSSILIGLTFNIPK